MGLVFKYKGKDITSSVTVEQYVHESYAEQHGDTLEITFRDADAQWDIWNPQIGDEIELINGNEKTGKMYLKKKIPKVGYYTLRASSLPQSTQVERSDSWEGITFLQIGKDIAVRHGLEFKSFGADNKKYSYLKQSNQKDLDFFEKLCVLEGCAFLIYDGKLILYSESYIEKSGTSAKLVIKGKNEFYYEEEKLYSGCYITNGSFSSFYLKENQDDYVARKILSMHISNKAEAEWYAKNMLRFLNKNKKKGYFYASPIAEGLAAGSVVEVETDAAQSFNGNIFITKVRHNFQKGSSKVFFRVPEEVDG